MGKFFVHLKPYWKSVILILVFLFVQAYCDLALPQYTSDIIDTGIQNCGVESVLPEQITAEEMETAMVFMTDDEQKIWKDIYSGSGDILERRDLTDKEEEEYDSKLITAVLLNYQMSAIDENSFRSMVATQSGQSPDALNNVSIEDIGAGMGVALAPFERTEEDDDGNEITVTCVDVRPVFAMMRNSGMMDDEALGSVREQINSMLDTMGESLVHSMGVAYAVKCDREAGMDVDSMQKTYLLVSGLKMLAMAFVMMGAAILVCLVASRVGAGIGRDLREKVFTRVVSYSGGEMDKFSTASLITRSTNDVQQIQMVMAIFLRMLLYAPIIGVGGIIKVSNTGAGMGWIIALAVGVILVVIGALMSIAMPKFKRMQIMIDKVNLVSREILTGLPVIRAFGREKKEEERFDGANRALTKTLLFTNRVMTFMMPLMMLVMYGLSILIIWVGSHRIDEGIMQVGAMTAFITYSMMIVLSFLMLTMMSVMLPRASVAAARIDEVLKTETSVKNSEKTETIKNRRGVVKFDNVGFRYPNAEDNVLSDINFTAEPGKVTAIVGSTGCGKSTLVHLIPRLYDATEGSISVDGIDIRNLTLEQLRDMIGFVPQKGVLFSGTIASNLRFGDENATEEELRLAADIAQATEFIDKHKEGLEREISQGGSNVSGGQKQRLTIARAIVKKPEILVFDDSFSALDLKTDVKLRAALGAHIKDSTVIIVAQRISTIIHADNIIVLEEGRIAGSGTHEELMESCEVYRQIAQSQLAPADAAKAEKGAVTNG